MIDDCGNGTGPDDRFFGQKHDDEPDCVYDCEHPRPMTREEAWNIVIDIGLSFGLKLEPRQTGDGYCALVPMEILKAHVPAAVEPINRRVRKW
jgi:hypothetical protein